MLRFFSPPASHHSRVDSNTVQMKSHKILAKANLNSNFCSNFLAQESNILTCQSRTLTAPKRHEQKDATEHHLEMQSDPCWE